MLLEALEDSMRTGMSEDQACPLNLTVEHVMPRAWREHWPLVVADDASSSLRDRAVDRLGNLTLVTERLNPSLSNQPWIGTGGTSGKRTTLLKHSVLKLNAELVARHESEWTESAIAARTRMLCQRILSIWARPSAATHVTVDLALAAKEVSQNPDATDDFDLPDAPSNRYQPLTDWLLGQTAEDIPATFAEIEEAMGFPLPGRARIDVSYWRLSARNGLARAINAGGYNATGVQLSEERLVLSRLPASAE
jgi:hypothetical protein